MSEPYRKKLIEVALPLEAINRESAREKSIRLGHPSTLHLWWSRKPLATCRSVLFASIVDDPSSRPDLFPTEEAQVAERQRLFRLIEELVKWENTTNESVLASAWEEIRKATDGHPPTVLDPFCGGGSIPLEAQRLGLDAQAGDLNPVAVLVTKALIEIPPKFAGQPPVNPKARDMLGHGGTWKRAQGLANDVRYYGKWMSDRAFERIGHLYPSARLQDGGDATVIAWLWARTVTCPNPACGAAVPLVRSFALSTRKGRAAWVEPVVDQDARTIDFRVRTSSEVPPSALNGTAVVSDGGRRSKATFRCIVCREGIAKGEYIDDQANHGQGGVRLLALVVESENGRGYVEATPDQLHAIRHAARLARDLDQEGELPRQQARGTFASNAQGRVYGFKTFADYFTERQVVALATFSDLVVESREQALTDGAEPAYADAIATYLALALDKGVNLWSSVASWMSDRGAFRETFARQGISMVWGFAEANPFSRSGGNFQMFVSRVADVIAFVPASRPAQAMQLDASAALNGSVNALFCTDPPYYDNVTYADLSDFFYVWLRRSLKSVYPDLFSTLLSPKAQELVATPYRFDGDRAKADRFFEEGLGRTFERMHEAAPTTPLTLFYAFKQAEEDVAGVASTGWETMLHGLLSAGFAVTGTWPMRTESSGRSVAQQSNALASSIALVCRPRAVRAAVATRGDFMTVLRAELPDSLRKLQHGNIAPVDLAQAAIGPGMAVFSRYAKVVEADGQPMTVRAALGLINKVLDEILAKQEGDFDPDTRFAIAWFEQYGTAEGPFGAAETLSKAKNVGVNGLVEAGVLESRGGKVRLVPRSGLERAWDPARDGRVTVWEVTQHLAKRLDDEGESGAATLLAGVGGFGEIARELAYRLYAICERKSWAQEALKYNALVASWPEIARLASQTTEPTQGSLEL